jgi:hypothetical protein
MALNMYWKSGLTGGTSTDLDGIDGANLVDGDVAFVFTTTGVYKYLLDDDGGAGESSPLVIVPDSNPGTKNWVQVGLAEPQEWTGQQNFDEEAITSSTNSVAWNLDTAQCAVHTLTENTTIASPTNMNAGGCYQLRVVQAAGVYTLAWNAVFKWGTASTPAEPAANGDVVIFAFYSDGTNMYGLEVNRTEA